MSPYNRLGSLTYEASFACHLLHHLASRCSFCASAPWNVLLFFPFSSSVLRPWSALLASPRCTVAFGLCIIITVTTSSSWLVVAEESHLVSAFATATNPVNGVLSRQALLERDAMSAIVGTRSFSIIKFCPASHAIPCSPFLSFRRLDNF